MTTVLRFPLATLALLTLLPRGAAAEVEIPRRCPKARLSQDVGLTEISVDYSSPAVRGRTIWGAAVPYGQMWRTGDNPAAKITFSREVVLAGQKVPAGAYALLVIPAPGEWTLVLNHNVDQAETSREYRPELEVTRAKVRARPTAHREHLTFLFSDFTDEDATLDLEWEKVRVSIPIKVNTRAQLAADIGSLDSVWRSYANAARYMLETKKDYDAGLGYIDKSLALGENWHNLWLKASLLAAKGRFKDAHEEAEKAYRLGKEASEAGGGVRDPDGAFPETEVAKALASWDRTGGQPALAPQPALLARGRAARSRRPGRGVRPVAAALGPGDDPPLAAHEPAPAAGEPGEVPRMAVTLPAATETSTQPAAFEAGGPASATAPTLAERPVAVHAPSRPAPTSTPPPSEIAPIIERGKADIQRCYQRALRQNPDLKSGKLVISITVGVSGSVRDVAMDGPERFGPIQPCIKQVVSRWAFPASSAEYGAELPIVLQGNE
jgi:hypothetical protein